MSTHELLLLRPAACEAEADALAAALTRAGLPTDVADTSTAPTVETAALLFDGGGCKPALLRLGAWRLEAPGRRALVLLRPACGLHRLPTEVRGVVPLQLPSPADTLHPDALERLVVAVRSAPASVARSQPPPSSAPVEPAAGAPPAETGDEQEPPEPDPPREEDRAPRPRATRGQKILLGVLLSILGLIGLVLGVGFATGKLRRGMFYERLSHATEWVDRGRTLVADAERQLDQGVPQRAKGLARRAVRQYERSKRAAGTTDETVWATEMAGALDVLARASLQLGATDDAIEATDEGIALLTPLPGQGLLLARLIRLRTVAGIRAGQPASQGLTRLRMARGLVANEAGTAAELERARLVLVTGYAHATDEELDDAEAAFSEAIARARPLAAGALIVGRATLGLAAAASARARHDDAVAHCQEALIIGLMEVQRTPQDRRLRWLVGGTKTVLGEALRQVDEPSARRAYEALAAAADAMPSDYAPAANMLRSIASDFAHDVSLLPEVAFPLSEVVLRANRDDPVTVCNHAEVTLAAGRGKADVDAGLTRCMRLSDDAPVRRMAAHALTLVAATEAGETDRASAARWALLATLKQLAPGRSGWTFAGSRAAIERRGSPHAAALSSLLEALEAGDRAGVDAALALLDAPPSSAPRSDAAAAPAPPPDIEASP